MNTEIETRIEQQKMQVVLDLPYLADLLRRLTLEASMRVDTFHTDGSGLVYYNPEFCQTLGDIELRALLVNEALHLLYAGAGVL